MKRFKWLIERNDGGVWGDDPDGNDDTVVLRSTDQTADGHWKLDEPALRKLSESDRRGATLEIGDLLVTKSSGSALHIGKTTLVDERVGDLGGCYSNFMQRLRLNAGLLPKLAWYVMNNELARSQFDLASNSTTGLANLNGTMISDVLVPVPGTLEQASITTFLDHETAKIDGLIAEQEKLIALLAEKRQATISHAVTRGLNPQAPMKDSGVSWLGEVPAHWEVRALRRVIATIEQGWSPECHAREAEATEWGVLKAGCLNGGVFRPSENKALPPDLSPEQKYEVRVGDVLMSRASGSPELVGSTALVTTTRPGLMLSDKIFRLHLQEAVAPSYFVAVMGSLGLRAQIENALSGGNGMANNLPQSSLLTFSMTVPPQSEQQEIVDFVDGEVGRIDSLRGESERAIALLKERRSALIAAAVTGQIDVRGLTAAGVPRTP
ncbi:hypothetical protein [Roseateles sp. P5_E7]